MGKFKKAIRIIFLVSIIIYGYFLIFKFPLPGMDDIYTEIIETEPVQKEIDGGIIYKEIDNFNYEITSVAEYEIYGLVVSQYYSKNFLDITHKKDPANIKDLCVVWGENIKNGAYKDVNYKSGEFTCFFQFRSNEIVSFSPNHLSNNHLIPANKEVGKKIKNAQIGDQIYIKGYLANYSVYSSDNELISKRGTSLTREDDGNGACEVIYVEELDIFYGFNSVYKLVKTISGYLVLTTLALSIILFFV